MKISILMLLLFPALPSWAQENEHAEKNMLPTEYNVYKYESAGLVRYLQNPSVMAPPPSFQTSSRTISEEIPLIGQDYFPAELFLNNKIRGGEYAAIIHDFNTQHFDQLSLIFDDKQYEHLNGEMINDRYALQGKASIKNDFHYNNTYFLFRDESGHVVATISYIEETIGFLKSEYRIIKKGSEQSALSLLVTPNPADHEISISYTTDGKGSCNLWITDMSGRIVRKIVSSQSLESGHHVTKQQIDLPSGQYLLSLEQQGHAQVSQKLIIK